MYTKYINAERIAKMIIEKFPDHEVFEQKENGVTKSVRILYHIEKNLTPTELNQTLNSLVAKTAEYIASNRELISIDLSYNPISNDAISAIAASMRSCKSIVSINLSYTNITHEGLKTVFSYLESHENLQYINLETIDVSKSEDIVSSFIERHKSLTKIICSSSEKILESLSQNIEFVNNAIEKLLIREELTSDEMTVLGARRINVSGDYLIGCERLNKNQINLLSKYVVKNFEFSSAKSISSLLSAALEKKYEYVDSDESGATSKEHSFSSLKREESYGRDHIVGDGTKFPQINYVDPTWKDAGEDTELPLIAQDNEDQKSPTELLGEDGVA
ncbi:MAG: hypothetical protein SFT68_00540 [Rickettsiaceae bacterium]|nr:hypothetical protein [Rickettsiaceae bacterium]